MSRAGLLRHRINLQRNAGTPDAAGEVVPTWTNYAASLPAQFRGLGGSEVDRADQRTALASAIITIRYRDDVSPEHRVVWGSRTFHITRVTDSDGRGRWLDLEVTELP